MRVHTGRPGPRGLGRGLADERGRGTWLVAASITLVVFFAGCNSPTAPTTTGVDTVPQVAGIYTGPITITVTGAPGEPPIRGTAAMTITVTQVGREVTLTGTLTAPGEPPTALWDDDKPLTGTVDDNGVFHGSNPEDYNNPDCGRVMYDHWRLTFGYGTLALDASAVTADCGRFEFDADLNRL